MSYQEDAEYCDTSVNAIAPVVKCIYRAIFNVEAELVNVRDTILSKSSLFDERSFA
ncbi:hypothetical protein FACS1894122_00870 [Alphaproteobacteria bacterium]|nr:hypothetical protein FACS1894122_00870 [Alphaproteobacteria bacterium]